MCTNIKFVIYVNSFFPKNFTTCARTQKIIPSATIFWGIKQKTGKKVTKNQKHRGKYEIENSSDQLNGGLIRSYKGVGLVDKIFPSG